MVIFIDLEVEKFFLGVFQYFVCFEGYYIGVFYFLVVFFWDEFFEIRDFIDYMQIEDKVWGCVMVWFYIICDVYVDWFIVQWVLEQKC